MHHAFLSLLVWATSLESFQIGRDIQYSHLEKPITGLLLHHENPKCMLGNRERSWFLWACSVCQWKLQATCTPEQNLTVGSECTTGGMLVLWILGIAGWVKMAGTQPLLWTINQSALPGTMKGRETKLHTTWHQPLPLRVARDAMPYVVHCLSGTLPLP